jgi:PLP dependent protein
MAEATQDSAAQRLAAIQSDIAAAAKIAGRKSSDITLIAVSKTRSAAQIRPLINAGQRVFGENRVQEASDKWPGLRDETMGIKLHLIGQLQSNKAEEAVALFDVIHSVDRMSLLVALGKAMAKTGKQVLCYLQVNIGDEAQKGGCAIGEVPELLNAASQNGVPVIGLMCLPPANVEPTPYFALLAQLAARHNLAALSMGMSGDFETAVMLGATHIRVGTALFGERPANGVQP